MSFPAALLALFVGLLVGQRTGAARLVSHLAEQLGRSAPLLLVACLSALLTTSLAAFSGAWLSSLVIGFERALLIALGLVAAAVRLAFGSHESLPDEPTRSIGAIFWTLSLKQQFDPVRSVVFASAAGLAQAWHAIAGGGLAAVLAMLCAWSLGKRWTSLRILRWAEFVMAAILTIAAVLIAKASQ